MKETEIYFPLVPVAKGRPKFTRQGHSYTPKRTADFEKSVRELYTADFFEGPINVKIQFYMPIPKSYTKKQKKLIEQGFAKYTKKPDVDNLAKAVLDALNGIAYGDDAQITKLNVSKEYRETPGIQVTIREDTE